MRPCFPLTCNVCLPRTDTCVRLLRDPQDPRLRFVLRIATALRDKPKPPKPRCAPWSWVA